MKVIPGVEYTKEQIAEMRNDPEVQGLVLKGYVLAMTIGGGMTFIHASQAAGGGHTGNPTGKLESYRGSAGYGREVSYEFDKNELPPIVKRTPQQRMDSLMAKAGEDLKAYLAGLEKRNLDGEEVKAVARDSIEEAEVQFEEHERKLITRTSGSPQA